MDKAMKKKFAGGDLVKGTTNLRTRSDDEIGDTDRFGNYKPGSYAARQEQGQKSLDSVKGFFNRLTGKSADSVSDEELRKGYFNKSTDKSADSAAPATYEESPVAKYIKKSVDQSSVPAAPVVPLRNRMEVGPAADEGMNKTIREAIGKRPTGMSPGSDVNQAAPESTAVASSPVKPQGNSQNKPETKPLKPAKPLPNVKTQSLKSVAEDRKVSKSSSSSGDEMSNYAKQKEAERDAKKRKDMDLKSVIPSKEDMQTGLEMAVPAGALTRQAMALAKKLAAKKAAKSTAPYLKELANEKLKLPNPYKDPWKYRQAKGGAVKMASGGVVGNASKRADGIAQRGKTKCKTY